MSKDIVIEAINRFGYSSFREIKSNVAYARVLAWLDRHADR